MKKMFPAIARGSGAAALLLLLFPAAGPVLAQDVESEPSPQKSTPAAGEDSKVDHDRRRARELAVTGGRLCGEGKLAECREALTAAHAMWPNHFQFAFMLARAEALLGHREAALALVEELGASGYLLPLEADEALAKLRREAAFERALGQLGRFASRTVERGEVAFRLPGRDLIPEGVAIDPATGDAWVGSIRHRKIVRRNAAGEVSDFATKGLWAVFGLVVDPERGRLWAATGAVEQMAGFEADEDGKTALVAWDLGSGKEVGRYPIPKGEGEGHRLNDLCLTPDGAVLATDNRLGGGVWRLDPGEESPRRITKAEVFRSPQGITFDARGRLFVADYSYGLARVDLGGDGEAQRVHFVTEPERVSLIGIDGLAAHGDQLIAVQNGVRPIRILRLRLGEPAERVQSVEILELGHPLWSEPTLGTVVGDDYFYVANSQWDRFDGNAELPPLEELAEPAILRIDLR